MASRAELSSFLAKVERRAFKQAVFAVRDNEAALDIVQDSMMRLSARYGANPLQELPLLFQRILQNAIRDYYRRARTRAELFTSFSTFEGDDDDAADPLERIELDDSAISPFASPYAALLQAETLHLVEEALQRLPPRQRQAFLLRYWEGLDIAETSAVMGCTEGSVKTHCSRAAHALAATLENKGVRP